MIDCFDRMVVSWSIGTRPDAELVNTMLDAAIEMVTASSDRPVVHSDRAATTDNAACEGVFSRLKNEMFYSRDWLSTTIEEYIAAVDTYIRWYNEARIKVSLDPRSPVDHRRNLGIAA